MNCAKCGETAVYDDDALCNECTDEHGLCQSCGEEPLVEDHRLGRNCLKRDVGACPKCDGPLDGLGRVCLDGCGG